MEDEVRSRAEGGSLRFRSIDRPWIFEATFVTVGAAIVSQVPHNQRNNQLTIDLRFRFLDFDSEPTMELMTLLEGLHVVSDVAQGPKRDSRMSTYFACLQCSISLGHGDRSLGHGGRRERGG